MAGLRFGTRRGAASAAWRGQGGAKIEPGSVVAGLDVSVAASGSVLVVESVTGAVYLVEVVVGVVPSVV